MTPNHPFNADAPQAARRLMARSALAGAKSSR